MIAPRDDGFTLVEVLVAASVLAGALILGFQIFANNISQLSAVERRMKVAEIAQFELQRASSEAPIRLGSVAGRTDGIEWKIIIAPISSTVSYGGSTAVPVSASIFVADEKRQFADVATLETVIIGRLAKP
jgi:prepilin-type N-terminal cleavage/methylation domain-containing protein